MTSRSTEHPLSWRRLLVPVMLALLGLGLVSSARGVAPALSWKPEKTWLFVVGILEWKDTDTWSPFPEAVDGRCDQQLVDFFKKSGVPKDQIVYLQDKQATLKRIQKSLPEFLGKPGPGDLFIFYFAGHGWWDSSDNKYYFANYDDSSDLWPVRSIFDAVEENFQGGQVLFLADCCHSGGMLLELKKRRWTFPAACLTSTYAHNFSTGSWTFSECLLKALRGDAQLDYDGDGAIGLDELARYTEREMAFFNAQKSVFSVASGFSPGFVLAGATGKRDPNIGRHVEVRFKDGKWYRAVVVGQDDDGVEICYCEDESKEVVADKQRIRPYQPAMLPRGSRVKVTWTDGEKYDAVIREAWYGLYFIHYPDYEDDYDEWVSDDQVSRK